MSISDWTQDDMLANASRADIENQPLDVVWRRGIVLSIEPMPGAPLARQYDIYTIMFRGARIKVAAKKDGNVFNIGHIGYGWQVKTAYSPGCDSLAPEGYRDMEILHD